MNIDNLLNLNSGIQAMLTNGSRVAGTASSTLRKARDRA